MEFSSENAFLVFKRDEDSAQGVVAVVPEGPDAFGIWNASTRLSPIFGVDEAGKYRSPTEFGFSGDWSLIFLGPIHPEKIPFDVSADSHVWLTIGLFNVVVATTDAEVCDRLTKWAEAQEKPVPFERWKIHNGVVTSTEASSRPATENGWRNTLATLWKSAVGDELKEAIQEYCPLMASTIARAANVPCGFESELLEFNETVAQLLEAFRQQTSDDRPYWALGQFLVINAALSRFSSQTFAGTSPIAATECHFWLHSLLGIGLATTALRNVRTFLESTLGEARLHERFAELRNKPNRVDLTKQFPPDEDYLAEIELSGGDPVVPLLAYFSARDGYRSTEMTVSAPLAAVSACNSLRWSLLTLTHEFSHVVIRAIQAELYPRFDDLNDLNRCVELIEARAPGNTIFDEIRRLLLFSIVKMDDDANSRPAGESIELNPDTLTVLLQRWRTDIDEIMVHAFDFMYFYGQEVDRYVAGIWASWGTIPNIRTRVLDYVVRTICAVLTKHLRRLNEAEQLARDQVLHALQKLQSGGGGGPYIKLAIDYMTNQWESLVKPRVRARRQLVKIVKAYLFSESIATAVRGEAEIRSSGEGKKEGYPFKKKDLTLHRLTNPLHFAEVYTDTLTPNATQSVWMLYVLAFCIDYDG